MSFYVYIIQSEKDQSYYKGFTENYLLRLEFHNKGCSTYTSRKIPWRFVYIEEVGSKKEGLRREKNLKKATKERIIELINSPKNLINKSGEVGERLKPAVC